MTITNPETNTTLDEIAPRIFRISTPVPPNPALPAGFSFNQFLIAADEPLLFHTGPRRLFPLVLEAVRRVLSPETLRYVGFSHVEGDECGSLDEWLGVAPRAVPLSSHPALTESELVGPSEVMRKQMDYYAHGPHTRQHLERLAAFEPRVLACMQELVRGRRASAAARPHRRARRRGLRLARAAGPGRTPAGDNLGSTPVGGVECRDARGRAPPMSDTVVLPVSPVAFQLRGDVIAGKYRLEHELGRGAMGTVWAATHVTLGQRVAIKLIAGDQSRSAEARQRFGIEAKAAARLRSRHVVQVYDDGETPDGTPYIVMEYLEGQTLEQRLDGQNDLGLGEAVRITTHVGRALARAHAQGVVHRDLKSGNIFIAKSDDDELGWVAKVLDFGVAKVLTEVNGPSATKTGTIVGTPLFMSPEQIRGASHVDHRADLYSLGMVFYNMVTGLHAFDGPSYSDVLVAICTEELPDIRVAAPWLPQPLRTWFDKACARERDDRFQSADEMVEALQDAAGPASRMSRPSVPEEVSGPSGTLVGHVPPHAAATILAMPPVELPASLASAASPAHSVPARREAGTSARDAPVPLRRTQVAGKRPRSNDNLILWGITGVGLACGTMALWIALARRAPAAPLPLATPTSHAVGPAPHEPPKPSLAATVHAEPPPPSAPAAPTETPPTRRGTPLRPRGPAAVAAAKPAPVTDQTAPARRPAPAAPDMGF